MLLVQTISKSIKSLAQRYHRLRLRYLALHRENYHLKTQCSKMKEATKDADEPSAIVIAQSIIRHTDKDDSGGVVGTRHQQCNLSNDQRGQLADLSLQTSVSSPKSRHAKGGLSVSPNGLGTRHQQCNLSNDQRGQLADLSLQTSVSSPKSRHAKRGLSVSPNGYSTGLYILSEASARFAEADDLVKTNLRADSVRRRVSQSRQLIPKTGLTSFASSTLSNTPLNRVTTDANGNPVQAVANRQSFIHGSPASSNRKNLPAKGY